MLLESRVSCNVSQTEDQRCGDSFGRGAVGQGACRKRGVGRTEMPGRGHEASLERVGSSPCDRQWDRNVSGMHT